MKANYTDIGAPSLPIQRLWVSHVQQDDKNDIHMQNMLTDYNGGKTKSDTKVKCYSKTVVLEVGLACFFAVEPERKKE